MSAKDPELEGVAVVNPVARTNCPADVAPQRYHGDEDPERNRNQNSDNREEEQPANQVENPPGQVEIKCAGGRLAGIGATTSIFIFKTGQAQGNREFMACHMQDDGLNTVKNQGRHDTRGKWDEIEARWVDIVQKQAGDETVQWHRVTPSCMSYQQPLPSFSIEDADFTRVLIDYWSYENNKDTQKLLGRIADSVVYGEAIVTRPREEGM